MIYMKRIELIILLMSLMFINSCNDGDSAEKLTPTNLTLQVNASSDGSGLVSFIASANSAIKYNFYFGEDLIDPGFVSADGVAAHTYLSSGTFKVIVVGYSIDNLFVTKTIDVTIQVNEKPISDIGYSTPLSYENMSLVWQDEFDGTELNLNDWTHETGNGGGGWGNNELEFYQSDNTSVKDGYLLISAKKEIVGGFNYTSSRIITKGNKGFKYGRVDIRAILPKGQGIWPALWMLGANINEPGVGWPKCGELDIMELIGGTGSGAGRNDKVYGTAHWDNAGSYASYGGNKTLAGGKIFADEFHVFSITWTETAITWYVDDVQFHVIDITPDGLSEFKEKFFFIFNVAVGGNWPGSPDAGTAFPQRMIVDYIRVFQ